MAQIVQQSQRSLWESFQNLLGAKQPPVTPVGQPNQPNVNPFGKEFLANMEKFGSNMNQVQATPYQTPNQNAYGQGFGNMGGDPRLPADSYAAAIQSMVASYRR